MMNSLAQVTDTWRDVEAAGNQLLAGLNVFYNGQLATAPNHLGISGSMPTRASTSWACSSRPPSSAGSSGISTGPTRSSTSGRGANTWRTTTGSSRVSGSTCVTLNLFRRQFEITREALLIAATAGGAGRIHRANQHRASSGAGQSAGLNVISAQNALLSNKNSLIGTWIQYEEQRLALYRDFDIMNIDAQGVWTNDDSIPTFNGGPVSTTPDPVGAPTEPLLPPPAPAAASPFAPRELASAASFAGGPGGCRSRRRCRVLRPGPQVERRVELRSAGSRPCDPRHAPHRRHRAGQPRERQDRRRRLRALRLPEQDHPAHPGGEQGRKGEEIVCRFDSAEIDKNIAQQEIKSKQPHPRSRPAARRSRSPRNKGESEIIAATVELQLGELDLEMYQKGTMSSNGTRSAATSA